MHPALQSSGSYNCFETKPNDSSPPLDSYSPAAIQAPSVFSSEASHVYEIPFQCRYSVMIVRLVPVWYNATCYSTSILTEEFIYVHLNSLCYLNSILRFWPWSIIHPCSDPIATQSGGKSKSARSHGKVADQVPGQADELDNHGDHGEENTLNLYSVLQKVSNQKALDSEQPM